MKISVVSVRDTGGTGWNLAHAINNVCEGEHQAIDITAQKSYINYPTMAYMGDYDLKAIRKLIYQSDALVLLGSFKPIIEGLKLSKHKLRDISKLLLFMGSEWRYGKTQLLKTAREMLRKNYDVALGGPGMFNYDGGVGENDIKIEPSPRWVKYLPFTRSFDEIRDKWGLCNQDHEALDAFGVEKTKVIFVHAPTSEVRKGSNTFYLACSRLNQMLPNTVFSSVRGQPWVNCLKSLASSDVLLDQDPPFPEVYGAISIEASIFKMPVVTRMDPEGVRVLEDLTGLKHPFIQWADDDDLLARIYKLATDPELREAFGERTYEFGRALHDNKPVVDRFFKIIEGI